MKFPRIGRRKAQKGAPDRAPQIEDLEISAEESDALGERSTKGDKDPKGGRGIKWAA